MSQEQCRKEGNVGTDSAVDGKGVKGESADSAESVLFVPEMRNRVEKFLTSGSNMFERREREEFRGRECLTDAEILSALEVYSFAIAKAANLSPEDVNRLYDALSA